MNSTNRIWHPSCSVKFTGNNCNWFFFLIIVADLIFSHTIFLWLRSENFKDDNGKMIKIMEILFQFLRFYSTGIGRSY